MKPISKCDINAMELLEQALEIDAESEREALIAGAPVPTAIRRMALDLLNRKDELAGPQAAEHSSISATGTIK